MSLTRPSDWATDANYAAGAEPWSGEPTKVEPSAGRKQTGHIPSEILPADWLNYLIADRGEKIEIVQTHFEATCDAFGLTITDANTDALAEVINARALALALSNTEVLAPNFAGKTATAVHVFGALIIAGFSDGAIYTSADNGATWSAQTSNTTKKINAFADNGTIVVAVCDDREIVTSTDGVTWTARTSNATGATIDIDCVVWDSTNALFIAAGDIDPTYGYIGTSPDGTTWTKQTAHHTGTAVGFARIAAGGGKACAISQGAGTYVSFSTNGTTWGAAVDPSGIITHRDVLHVGGGVFAILGSGLSNALSATTSDGAVFTLGTAAPSSSSGFGKGIAIDGALWGASSGYLYRSFNGLAWKRVAFRDASVGELSAFGLGRLWVVTGEVDQLVRSLASGAL
jgi:hypothetical protein